MYKAIALLVLVVAVPCQTNAPAAQCTKDDGTVGQCVPYYLCNSQTANSPTDGDSCVSSYLDAYIEICAGAQHIVPLHKSLWHNISV